MDLRRVGNVCLLGGLAALLLAGGLAVQLHDNLPYHWPRTQRINCVNNLHQIAQSLRMWGMDNQDTYPYNLSTNAGGTLEFCDRDKDDLDRNSFLHYQVMSNELNTPKVLVCPDDRTKHPAPDFAHLRPENVSYPLRTGTNVTEAHPDEIITTCPVHGNFIRCDGSVTQAKPDPEPWWRKYKDLYDYDEKVQLSFYRIVGVLAAGLFLLALGTSLKLWRRRTA